MEKVKSTNKLVKDYEGNLIPKTKARKICNAYYEENVSCFLMEDGQWYRITSEDKIIYDHYSKKYVLKSTNKLVRGIVGENKEIGMFSQDAPQVRCFEQYGSNSLPAMTEDIAKQNGYVESISNGNFYLESKLTDADLTKWFNVKNIPDKERSKSYTLEADQNSKKALSEAYKNLEIKISKSSREFAKFLGDLSFGVECEVINGFLPQRIREKYGFKALKDGSLRSDKGEGIEYVSVPMEGAKGIQVLREICYELTRRCEVNNYCSVHFHFGNIRKDKLFTLGIYNLIKNLQAELQTYFPYSRFNSIKSDGKVYCNPLHLNSINYSKVCKSKTEEEFKHNVFTEFNKIYTWLNNGQPLGEEFDERVIKKVEGTIDGKAVFGYKWFRNVYTTKSINNAVTGEKWNKVCRYSIVNFLNMFFSKKGTIEFRPHEGSTNSTKILIWFLTCISIINYAYDVKRCLELTSIKLENVLEDTLGKEYAEYIMAYYQMRNKTFFNTNGTYKDYKSIEAAWFKNDATFSFKNKNIEIK